MWWSRQSPERTLLASYYQQWDQGNLCFPLRFQNPADEVAHRHLQGLGLLITDYATPEPRVSLTQEGVRLGKIYSGSWWGRSGLWFADCRDHWFWLLLSFLGGIIGALLVNWLT